MLLLLLVAVSARAQIENGKVYRFVNAGKSDRSMAIGNQNNVVASTTVDGDYGQLWYAASNGSGCTLRNLANGRYLYSPNATSGAWLTSKEVNTDNSVFTATRVGGNFAIAVSGKSGYNYMHADGGNNIVCWESSNANSQWTITEVTNITSADLDANWEVLNRIDPSASTISTYQGYLETLFEDAACTTLKSTYASMSESTLKNQAAYQNLPEALQNMVLKVRNNSWAEDNYDNTKNDWDADYAKKYRVQLYEPYNNVNAAAEALGLNAHTNLNNPTGIFANNKEAVYVMVQGTIKDGASLYLTSYTGHGKLGNDHTEGIRLTEGLNIVPSFADGNNYIINYVVETFDVSNGKRGNKAKARELSDYAPLKIHIEGGYINGYYNKVGDALYTPDKNADWEYIEARATQTDVTVLGKYITLQFPLNDDHTEGNKGLKNFFNDQVLVEDCIDEWDNVMLWERLVLGVLDETTTKAEAKTSPYSSKDVFEYTGNDADGYNSGYGDYYNVHGLSFGVGGDAYMYGGWDHCGYHYNTMGSIIGEICTSAGSHWGPGHEIGHQHQKLLTVNGLTEVTNNLFSNVVLWYYGETTSRYNGSDGALSNVLAAYNTEGSDFFTNNIWALTHMYYKLFLYYHVLGHNTKFYPRLFEMLRQDPMSGGYNQNGATSLLHFYKKCCLASGDDLTEFFRAHGFFSVMDNRLVGDYSNSVYTTTQADIDAAIKEVKDLGYDENIAVLFINDATGETIKSHKGDNLELYGETRVCAEVGSYASFADNTTPNYTYSVSGSTVTMEGTGGTGFAIFNEKGEIIAFSDKKTFEVSSECAVAIASGKAEIKAVKADNTPVEAVDVMDTNDAEAKYEALGELLTATADLLTYADADNSKPGFYRASVMETLQQLYDEAQSVYDNKEVASYATAYAALAQEYTRIAALDTDKTPFLPGSTYVLTNKKYPNVSMALDNNALIASATNMSNSAQQWTFETTDEADIYYLKNGSNYMGSLSQSTQVGVTTKELASRYKLFDLGKGLWALQCQNDLEKLMSLHCNEGYKIVGWTHTATDNDGSWWYLTATTKDESMLPLYDLQNLIAKTEALVDEIATVQGKGTAVELSAENITSNATESGHETKYLTDGNPSTFFHTVWSGSVVNDYHNIVIDLGEGHSLAEFVLNYSTLPTTADNVDAPESLTIQGSNDGSSYTDIASLSALSNGLPTSKGSEYTSSTLGSASQAYRYIRLQVKTATGNKLGSYYYFGLAELSLLRMATLVDAIGDKYQNFVTADALKAACDQVYAAQQAIATGSATSDDVAALQEQYDILLAAYENANNVEFNAKKEELLALISSTNSLINSCGTITYTPATLDGELALQATKPNESWYVSSNADQNTGGGGNDGGGIAALVDNNYNTYFHTRWGGTAVSEPHHIQVDMGNGVAINDFVFSYKPRNGSPAPTSMIVYGSNDENSFTEVLATISSGLPTHDSGITYTSSTIVSDKAYRYLRFTVTGSQGPGNNKYNNQYFFGMLEFDLTAVGRPESYTAELGAQPGEATSDLLLATYHAANDAQIVYDNAITENQVQDAINALQAQYDALFNAKYPSVEFSISVTGGNGNGGVLYKDAPYTTTLQAPEILTVGELSAIPLDGYVAKSVTLTNRVITVVYNKVYTVEVTGGKGNGGITYDGKNYADGETFDAEQGSFSVNELTAIIPDGYILKEAITLNHETGVINVAFSARPLVDITKYYTLACKANHSAYIRDNGSVINGRSTEGSLFQFEKANDDNGYYIKSYVTDKYLNSNGTSISVDAQGTTVWTLALHSTGAMTLCIGNDLYLNNNGAANTACPYLQLKGHNGGPAPDNACSLWTITEGTPLDKSALLAKINEFEPIVDACVTDPLFVTEQLISEIRNVIADARAKYESKATTQSECDAALAALSDEESRLEEAKDNAEIEAAARAEQLVVLREWIVTVNDLMARCAEDAGDATQALIDEVSEALQSANELADSPSSTSSQLADAAADLEAKYAVLAAAQQSNAKAELRELIAQTQALIAECGTYGYGEHMVKTPVALQATNKDEGCWISSNADQNTGGGSNDGGGIAALVDNNPDTYFHTRWGGDIVNEAHYIQVDMGVGKTIEDFAFNYTARNDSPAPTEMTISGSNDGITFEYITRISKEWDDYNNDGTFTSEIIDSSLGYRYLRFTVTKSNGPGNETYGEKYFFGMREFDLFSISYETSYYVESLTSYGNVTEEQFLNVARAYDAANDLVENSYDKAALETATANLQAVYNVLLAAHNDYSYLPVTLTTDVENPVLYVMGSQRGAGKVLQYDSAPDHKFSIVDAAEVNVNHLFYFTKGTKKGQVYVHPFTAEGQVLAASNKEEGDAKVSVAEKEDDAVAMQWTFEQETIEATVWYSLKGVEAPYFSHHGGGSNKMGFYGSKDAGSRFTLTETKCHKVTIGEYLHTSLYLDYPTIIPEGVKAYIAKNPSEEGTIDLMKLQGNVLPATGVILYSKTPGTYYFLATNASATDNVNENLLKGCASEQYVGDETGAKKYYIFGRSGDEVGLYWARMDYTADGTYVGNDEGTHFKASANKVYLELDASQPALSGFRFRVGGDETGIEGITIDADATIYDLYGRRVLEVVTPGLYIINGEKRYINIK